MTQQLINMTPHPINIVDKDKNNLITIPVSGNQIRLATTTVDSGIRVNGIAITSTQFGEPVGLPELSEGVFYIVSAIVKGALPNRKDLLVPAEMQRNEDGNIIGCLSLGL
jgi:hypothetical protein